MEEVIKELKGHSGCFIFLMKDSNKTFVRKIGDVKRNYWRMRNLEEIIPFPEIYDHNLSVLDMEYIHGLDMVTYLSYNNPKKLVSFLIKSIESLSHSSEGFVDYTEVYYKKLQAIDWSLFRFSMQDLIDRLPKLLPKTQYHGDLTLENILYDTTNERFVFIDCLTSEYSSFVFDLAKLTQDTKSKWFLRKQTVNLDNKLVFIQNELEKRYKYMSDDNLTILMLLRVLPYCKNDNDKRFILNEVNRLWT